jgi:hypothetical protein
MIVEVHFSGEVTIRAEGSWFLLHDNAHHHSALIVKIFMAKHGVLAISHPSYSR